MKTVVRRWVIWHRLVLKSSHHTNITKHNWTGQVMSLDDYYAQWHGQSLLTLESRIMIVCVMCEWNWTKTRKYCCNFHIWKTIVSQLRHQMTFHRHVLQPSKFSTSGIIISEKLYQMYWEISIWTLDSLLSACPNSSCQLDFIGKKLSFWKIFSPNAAFYFSALCPTSSECEILLCHLVMDSRFMSRGGIATRFIPV